MIGNMSQYSQYDIRYQNQPTKIRAMGNYRQYDYGSAQHRGLRGTTDQQTPKLQVLWGEEMIRFHQSILGYSTLVLLEQPHLQ